MKIAKITLATTIALSLAAGTAAAATVLKLASFVPPNYVLHEPIFQKLADDVKAATNGDVEVAIYPSGELGAGPVEQYQRAVSRIAEISYGLPGYTSPLFPRTLLIELPDVSVGYEDATKKLWNAMDSHLRGEFKKTVPLGLFVTPPAVLMMTDKPVKSVDDLKGLKIRVPSKSTAAVIESWGATPVQMPANKVYTALSTGVVDGALMGSDSLLIFKLIEPTKYVVSNLPEMPTAIMLVMNEDAYNELTDDQKKAVDDATGLDMSLRAAKGLTDFGDLALGKFAGIEGKEIIELSAEARQAFADKARPAVEAYLKAQEDAGVPAHDVLSAMGQ